MSEISSKQLVQRVREYVGDRGANWWPATMVLDLADQRLQQIVRRVRANGRELDLAYYDIDPSALTQPERFVSLWPIPVFINSIVRIEGIRGSDWPIQFEQVQVDHKDVGRLLSPVWHRVSKSVRITGQMAGVSAIRVWYRRNYPPLHYGRAAGGSTTTIVFDATPDVPQDATRGGRILKQDGLYTGASIRFLSGANADLEVAITGYVRSTNTATFTPAVGAVAASDQYALMVPAPADLCSFLTIDTAYSLVSTSGNDQYLAAISPLYQQALEEFTNAISQPDTDSPLTIFSTDR